MTFDPAPYHLLSAVLHWLLVFGITLGVVLVLTFLFSLIYRSRSGPGAVVAQIAEGFSDLMQTSPRRVLAVARLTWKESLRRKALLVFVLFAALFMFAGWFMPDTGLRADLQVKTHVSFVLRTVAWLVVPVMLLLSCWSVPEDIRTRSLHTVVTKPVRRHEIVLGRIVGFASVGTVVLAIMSAVGWLWIVRQMPEDSRDLLVARVPVYGGLSFLDREGRPTDEGINVGDIWEFRSYIEGASKAAAIWEFDNVTPARMGETLRLEARFESFRTHKGDMDRGLRCKLSFVNPERELEVFTSDTVFEVKEYRDGENVIEVPRSISFYDEQARATRQIDLFDDLAPDGKLRVEAQCLDGGQFLGMARPDLFIRLPDRPFESGFFKAVLGVWMLMLLVVVFGVTASCFVKGPVASLLVFVLLIVGLGMHDFLNQLVRGEMEGSGTIESAYRIVEHMNPMTPLDETAGFKAMQAADKFFFGFLWIVYHVIPNFNKFRMLEYPANGFDVSWDAALLPSLAITLAYLLPCLLLAYYSLKLRELEAK